MKRYTYEQLVWEIYKKIGNELLDELQTGERDLIQRAFGIFPYRDHNFFQLGIALGVSKNSAYYRYKKTIRTLRKIIIQHHKEKLEKL